MVILVTFSLGSFGLCLWLKYCINFWDKWLNKLNWPCSYFSEIPLGSTSPAGTEQGESSQREPFRHGCVLMCPSWAASHLPPSLYFSEITRNHLLVQFPASFNLPRCCGPFLGSNSALFWTRRPGSWWWVQPCHGYKVCRLVCYVTFWPQTFCT